VSRATGNSAAMPVTLIPEIIQSSTLHQSDTLHTTKARGECKSSLDINNGGAQGAVSATAKPGSCCHTLRILWATQEAQWQKGPLKELETDSRKKTLDQGKEVVVRSLGG
jgi:hypothetical protein